MTIDAVNDNDINSIRRDWQVNPDIAVLGFSDDPQADVFVNGRPGYWWVRQLQAGGSFGPPQQVRGCTTPMETRPGKSVRLGLEEGEKAVLKVDFIGEVSKGVNPTQDAVNDPNANKQSFVNQAFISTAYAQIVENTLKVGIRGSVPLVAGVFVKVEGQVDFTGNVPGTGDHCVAAIAVLSDLSDLEVQYSTAKSTMVPLDLDDLNEAWALMSDPLTNKPLWAFDIGDGITALVEANKWMDIRQFLNWETPTSGGTFYQTVQGNGTPATQEPIIDFIDGTNTTVTVTDDGAGTRTKVKIDVTGVTSGINQLTGDVTAGPGTGSQAATLATVNSNIGSFTLASITVNAKGLITAAATGLVNLATQISGLLGLSHGGTGADLSATGGANQFVKQSSAAAAFSVGTIASADIATALTTPGPIGGTTPNAVSATHLDITGTGGAGFEDIVEQSATPSAPAATHQRAYIENSLHHLVRENSSGIVTDLEINPAQYADVTGVVTIASPGATIDGIAMSAGQIVLNTATSSEAGLWVWNGAAVPMTRPANYPTGSNTLAFTGMEIYILGGTTAGGFLYRLSTSGTIVIDTTSVLFEAVAKLGVTNFAADLNEWNAAVDNTIIGGILTAAYNFNRVKSQTGTTDDLETITANSARSCFIVLRAKATHTITVKNGTGNIVLLAGADIALTGDMTLVLFYNGTNWYDTMTTHTHQNAANGGTLSGAAIGSGTVAAARLGVMTGDSGSGGASGAVPAPATGDAVHGLFGDATYAGTVRTLVAYASLGADAANIDLTSISGSYKHLQLLLYLRSDRAATSDNVYIRLNNDSTAANYYGDSVTFAVATASAQERLGVTATAFEVLLGAAGNTAPANSFSTLIVDLFGYQNSANNRSVSWRGAVRIATTTGNIRPIIGAGDWLNTANAINRITILPVTGSNFKTGSSYMLLGIS